MVDYWMVALGMCVVFLGLLTVDYLFAEEWQLLTRDKAQSYGTEIYEIMPPFTQIELIPEVCILIPTDARIPFLKMKYLDATKEAINKWYNDLTIWVGHDENAFKIDVIVVSKQSQTRYNIPQDYPNCNVFIHFSYSNPDQNDASVGSTGFFFEDSRHKYADIVIYTHDLPRNVEPIMVDPNPDNWVLPRASELLELSPLRYNTLRQVVAHELGHAYGLGHYFAGENNPSRSIMEPMLDAWGDMTMYAPPQELDLYAMTYLYGFDGWYGYGFPPFERCMIANPNVAECN